MGRLVSKPGAMLQRLFSENNREGGFMQRCIPVLVPNQKRSFRPPRQNVLDEKQRAERDAALMTLYRRDCDLGDETRLLDLPMMSKAIEEWFDELEERYNDGLLTDAEADLSHRCGEFMMRAAIPLVALYGEETKEVVAFCRWVGEYAHYTMCRIFGHSVQKDIDDSKEMLDAHKDARMTVAPILSQLPETFSLKQLKEVRVKNGQSANVYCIIHRYIKKGKLKRLAGGMYQKV